MWLCRFQIERDNRRLRVACGFDFVVHLAQIGLGFAQQQHRGAMGCVGFGGGSADAPASAGNENDAALKQVGAGGVIKHIKPLREDGV